jgi:hypothetical protein
MRIPCRCLPWPLSIFLLHYILCAVQTRFAPVRAAAATGSSAANASIMAPWPSLAGAAAWAQLQGGAGGGIPWVANPRPGPHCVSNERAVQVCVCVYVSVCEDNHHVGLALIGGRWCRCIASPIFLGLVEKAA